jgi:hypothetical protein
VPNETHLNLQRKVFLAINSLVPGLVSYSHIILNLFCRFTFKNHGSIQCESFFSQTLQTLTITFLLSFGFVVWLFGQGFRSCDLFVAKDLEMVPVFLT